MTLLVVEDEYLILDFICAEMEDAGITSIGATTSDEAMRILRANPAITALVTDINMPGSMDGLKLARWVREQRPAIKIVVTSGKRTPHPYELPEGAVFVPKPFYPQQLMGAIR